MLAVFYSAALSAGFPLDYADPTAATAYVLTRETRIGASPGRPFRFLVDFSPAAASTLTESNALYSKFYGTNADGKAFDVISTPGVALNATFQINPQKDVSTLSFYGMAAALPQGAHICRRFMSPGNVPPHCDTGRVAEGTCDLDVGCSFRGKDKSGKETRVLVDASLPLKKCSENITLIPSNAKICTAPGILRSEDGVELIHRAPLGDNVEFAFWTDGASGRLHFFAEPEDPVERAGIALIATVAFLAWCESTRSLTPAVASGTSLPAIFAPPKIDHKAGVALTTLTPILFADVVGMLALSSASAVYHRGIAIFDPAVHRFLSKGFAEALAILLNAYAWYATALAWIVLVARVHFRRLQFMNESAEQLRSLALITRMTLETAIMATIHVQLPREKLGSFAVILGLSFGIVSVLILSRDTTLIWLMPTGGTQKIVAGLTAATFLTYAVAAMLLPAILSSTAVLNNNEASLAFSCTLALQVVGIGATAARRKLDEHSIQRQ